jgi:CelD/BcsL family acetyltransferase involved in cellulose biosynthesis
VHGMIEQGFRVERRPLAELGAITAEWQALARRALEPNVFLEPAFALAAAPVFGRDVAVDLVWSRASPGRLAGFLPGRIERRRYGIAPPVQVAWTHPFAPLGTPLLDRDTAAEVFAAWLSYIERAPELPRLLLMPLLPVDGEVARILAAALVERGGASAAFAAHQRALLAPCANRAHYLEAAIGGKRRKELRRQRRRLAETGTLRTETANDPAAVARALADFLGLESAGWKGRAGTAACDDDAIHTFMERTVAALADAGQAQIARLLLDDRPIAALVTLKSGATAWCWKISYDEALARYSPGVQLLLDATETLLADSTIARVDSCATAGHPMIDHIWRERLGVADLLMHVGPRPSFALARVLERSRRAAISGAKRLRDAVRG